MRQSSALPAIFRPGGNVQVLRSLPKVHNRFDESFLQDLLARNPALLPAASVRKDVGSLICVGREISLPSGSVDNLYLSTGGYPVLVETKLWRNPQARREVLSQTLDYIKDLATKDFEWFQNQWKTWNKDSPSGSSDLLEELSRQTDYDLDERELIDRVNRALARGDLLAMIVGDGIETRLQELVDHLCNESAHLRYVLTLCELAFYEAGPAESDGFLIVPRIVSNIEPVERAYVRVDIAPGLEEKLIVTPVRVAPAGGSTPSRTNLSADEFFHSVETSSGTQTRQRIEAAINELIEQFGLEPEYKAAAVMLKLPDPSEEARGASLIAFEKSGRIYNTTHMKGQLSRWETLPFELASDICTEYWKHLHKIDPLFEEAGMSHMSPKAFIPFARIQEKWPKIRDCIGATVQKIRQHIDKSGNA